MAFRNWALSIRGAADPFRLMVAALSGAHDQNPADPKASYMVFSAAVPSTTRTPRMFPCAIFSRAEARLPR